MAGPVDQSVFQWAEDAPHVSGQKGTAALVVRKDSSASLADTDGDYTLLQVNGSGFLKVTPGAIALVTDATKLTFAAAGTQTVHTTTIGQKLRLKWLYLKTPQVNANEIDVTAKIGALTIYRTAMSPVDVFSHTLAEPAEGATSADLTVTVGDVSTVPVVYPVILYVDTDIEEFV